MQGLHSFPFQAGAGGRGVKLSFTLSRPVRLVIAFPRALRSPSRNSRSLSAMRPHPPDLQGGAQPHKMRDHSRENVGQGRFAKPGREATRRLDGVHCIRDDTAITPDGAWPVQVSNCSQDGAGLTTRHCLNSRDRSRHSVPFPSVVPCHRPSNGAQESILGKQA